MENEANCEHDQPPLPLRQSEKWVLDPLHVPLRAYKVLYLPPPYFRWRSVSDAADGATLALLTEKKKSFDGS